MTLSRKVSRFSALIIVLLLWGTQAQALLEVDSTAPEFSLEAALAGEAFSFTLGEALKKGPVVVYFYPKAFTQGCSVEAKLFANMDAEFKALETTVIGISNDGMEILKKFSREDCGNKFAVASDPEGKVIKAYEANLMPLVSTAARISYVITPDHKVLYVYKAMKPEEHVNNTLEAIRQWKLKQPGSTIPVPTVLP